MVGLLNQPGAGQVLDLRMQIVQLIDDDAVHAIELQLVQAPIERTVERLHHALLHFAPVHSISIEATTILTQGEAQIPFC